MTSRPHLIVIMADQFRAMALGATGSDPTRTPHLDRLAREGVVVEHAVSNYPVCSPHRAMFLTSEPPSTNGVTHNVNSETAADGVGLRDGLATWASVLRERGYRTGYIGKWHLEPPTADDEVFGQGRRDDGKVWDAYSPPSRRFGFNEWHSYGAADDHLTPHYWVADAQRHERIDVDAWSAEHEIDVALDFVGDTTEDDVPFALMISLNPPHQPFDAVPERYRHGYDQLTETELLPRANVPHGTPEAAEAAAIARDYFSAVTAVDDQIGRLLNGLDDRGIAENTVVVFTSDHGMQLGSHGLLYKNVAYEESIRLPLIVRHPGTIPPGTSDEMVTSLDAAPTLLGLVGEHAAIPATMRGTDRSRALCGDADPAADPAATYYRFPSVASPDDVRGLRTREHKLIATIRADGALDVEAFDLRRDPFECVSDPASEAARVLARRLLNRLEREHDAWSGADALRQRYGLS